MDIENLSKRFGHRRTSTSSFPSSAKGYVLPGNMTSCLLAAVGRRPCGDCLFHFSVVRLQFRSSVCLVQRAGGLVRLVPEAV